MRVEDIIKTKGNSVITVTEDSSLGNAARIMKDQGVGALVVVTPAGRLHGVLSEREIVLAFANYSDDAAEVRVLEVTVIDGPVLAPTDRIIDAMKIMTERRVRHLPVVLEASVVGLLSIGDAVKARLSEKIAENLILQDMARWPHDLAA
jgi:CBS domain-containing protein